MRKDILQYHRYQSSWESCGAAGLLIPARAFGYALPSEKEIHEHIYDGPFDGSPPDRILKFCLENGVNCQLFCNITLVTAYRLITDGYSLMMLIKDYFPDSFESDPEGHWLILDDVDFKSEKLTFVDSSKALRYYKDATVLPMKNGTPFETRPRYHMKIEDLAWVDELPNHTQAEGLALAFGPKNKL